uniref:Uncharacterized protein n=1 Tax=Arsenophonus nasoniae TaxID=638 RepID=D2TWM4_9GAMM|nr:hypothetical protein ARN_04590 [Arsenophonus nasoniae]
MTFKQFKSVERAGLVLALQSVFIIANIPFCLLLVTILLRNIAPGSGAGRLFNIYSGNYSLLITTF